MTSDARLLHEHYRGLSDYDLARIALTDELTPEAREIIAQELQGRGLADLSGFKRRMEEDAVLTDPARYKEVSWEMGRRWRLSTVVAGLVAGAWIAAALRPIDILTARRSESLGSKLQVTGVCGALTVPSFYLGLRARREGRRLAFYLRAVVPLALLCASIAIVLASR